jgi:hypothetical protein
LNQVEAFCDSVELLLAPKLCTRTHCGPPLVRTKGFNSVPFRPDHEDLSHFEIQLMLPCQVAVFGSPILQTITRLKHVVAKFLRNFIYIDLKVYPERAVIRSTYHKAVPLIISLGPCSELGYTDLLRQRYRVVAVRVNPAPYFPGELEDTASYPYLILTPELEKLVREKLQNGKYQPVHFNGIPLRSLDWSN